MDSRKQIERTRRFFDAVASSWPCRYDCDPSIAARKARFLNAIQAKFPQSADILDFGCGSGEIALSLSEHGHRVTGYDLSEVMIAEARRADRMGRVRWLMPTRSAFSFEDATFDAMVASSVFEYLSDVSTTLTQLARVLRPGGWMFATVPDMRDPHRRREIWLRFIASAPILGTILNRSRWGEGADYLRISVNRLPPEVWQERLRHAGLIPGDLLESSGPLLLLEARKT
jgi:ubiquinone/menaquinone biosynthesis C-methylase UbiE